MGTHPIFESDFDCLTEDCENSVLDEKHKQRKNIETENIMKIREAQRLWRTQQILPQSQLQL